MNKIKTQPLILLTAVNLLLVPNVNFGQTPDLGTAYGFVLFTAVGAFNNTEALSVVTGDVGTNVGAFNAFPPGTLIGQIHVADGVSAQAATDVLAAYSYLSGLTGSSVISTTLDGQVLTPGLYSTGAASSLSASSTITLNGVGIYILQIGGALTLGASSQVIVSGGANLCDVYWQINGQVDIGAEATFRGTMVVDGAINLLANSVLYGRGLSCAGAIGTAAITATLNFPDLTTNITAEPNVMHGITNFNVIVKVTELNNSNTNGLITILIPRDTRLSFNYSPTATLVGGYTVNNSSWTYDQSDPTYHIFTKTNVISAGSFSRFGIDAVFDSQNSIGIYSITSQITSGSGGEFKVDNNSDAEKIDYFIQ